MKERDGSVWWALRLMSTIFVFNPVSLLAICGVGRYLLVTVFAPGLMGGVSAGSADKAMTAAAIVGAAYSFFNFVMVLSLFHFVSGLPMVGEHVGAALNSIGGFGVSAALVVAVIALPLVLALLISSYLGAKKRKFSLEIEEDADSVSGLRFTPSRRSPRQSVDHGRNCGPRQCRVCGCVAGGGCAARSSASTHVDRLGLDPLEGYLAAI